MERGAIVSAVLWGKRRMDLSLLNCTGRLG